MKNVIRDSWSWAVPSGTIVLQLLFPAPSNGQVSISDENFFDLIGTAVQLSAEEESMVSVNLGGEGANQEWDFTGLMPNEGSSDLSFLAPSGTPFADLFPEANFTLRLSGFEFQRGTIFSIFENCTR